MALPCNNLNLNLYRVFYTVAKTKSFSESSRTLHISQPAISKHIQNLEYELNTLLFYRTNRGIDLTPEAKVLFTYVEKAYNFLMLGERELQESKELMKGKVSIGVPTYISVYYLNKYVKEYMKEHPNIVIKMNNCGIDGLLEQFSKHALDILVIPSYYLSLSKDLNTFELIHDKYCFVYNKEKMANPHVHNLEELSTKPLLLPVRTSLPRKNLDECFNRKGLSIDPKMELENTGMIINYIKEGMGIGYLLESIAKSDDSFEIIELAEELPTETINIVYNETTLTTSSKEFINLIKNYEK